MPLNKNLSQSLFELSEAIKQLAEILQTQPNTDNQIHIKQFSVLVNRFSKTTDQLKTSSKASSKSIKDKHSKGFIIQWLNQKNMTAADYIDNLKADDYLYQAVDFLADHYDHLKDFYKQLKYHQSVRKNFTHTTSHQSISYIQNWCKLLQQHQLIDLFKQQNETEIFVDIAEVHTATNFIYGYWLEVLLRREIAQWMYQNIDRIHCFDMISQAHILKPDNKKTEFDLLLMINEKVYWFECKSGIIKEYYDKFNQHRNLLQLESKQAYLVIPHKDGNVALESLKRSGMSTLYGTELESQLKENIII